MEEDFRLRTIDLQPPSSHLSPWTDLSKKELIVMFRCRKLLWTAIVFAIFFFSPVKGSAVEVDPYAYRSLVLNIKFEYKKIKTESSGISREIGSFLQDYSLETRGNLISRRLFIYDAGFGYQKINYSFDVFRNDTDQYKYFLKTTFLSKSSIPLTLFGDVTESKSKNGKKTEDTATNYGFSWQSKIRRLPHVFVLVQKTKLRGTSADSDKLYYRLNVDKDIGPTKNDAQFYSTNRDNFRSGTKSMQRTLQLRNRTEIAKNTDLTASGVASVSEFEEPGLTSEEADVKAYGMSFTFTSKPSQEFNQSHNYTSFNTRRGDQKNDGDSYNGDLHYTFSQRMRGELALRINRDNDSSPTISSDAETLNSYGFIEYHLTGNLTLQERVSYYTTESTSTTEAGTNLTDRQALNVTTSLLYRRRLSWAYFSSNASVGYVDDTTAGDLGGKGISLGLGLGLTGIDVTKYALFNITASEARTKKFTGNIHSRTSSFMFMANSRAWDKYVKMRGSYSKSINSSYISALETKEEKYQFNANSDYIRNTSMGLDANRSHTFNSIVGLNRIDIINLYASHTRNLYGGRLNLSFRYNWRDIEGSKSSSNSRTASYSAKYLRWLFSRVFWQATAARSERDSDGTFTDSSIIKNSFLYQLRAWTLTADHTYTMESSQITDKKETILMLTASRQFYREY